MVEGDVVNGSVADGKRRQGHGCGRFSVRGRLRGPSGSPHVTFKLLPRRPTWLEAAGHFGNILNCARVWLAVSRTPRRHSHTAFAVPVDVRACDRVPPS